MVARTLRRRKSPPQTTARALRDRGERFDDSAPVDFPIRKAVAKALGHLSKTDYVKVLAIFHISIDNWNKIVWHVGTELPVDVYSLPNHVVRKLFRELVLPLLPEEYDAKLTTQYPEEDEDALILRQYRIELVRMMPYLSPRLLLAVVRIIEEVMPEYDAWQEEPEGYELDVEPFPAHLVCRLHRLMEPLVREGLENAYRDFMAIAQARAEAGLCGPPVALRRSQRLRC